MRRTTHFMIGSALLVLAIAVPRAAAPEIKRFALESAAGLRLHNVTATPATLEGKKGVRVAIADEAMKQMQSAGGAQRPVETLAEVEGIAFANGTIEAEIAGAPGAGAPETARGFVGIAFRVQPDARTYDAFYLRPTNGRADDQERRNHAAQSISHPDWPWSRLRKETPSKYESYVDLMPNTWTRIKIEVRGDRARLYVHGQAQPTLVVNDVKTGAQANGGVALWLDGGTVGHYRALTVDAN